MTCIVGVVDAVEHRVWIGGDSWGDGGWKGEIRADKKVFMLPNHNMAIGFTSSFRMGQLIRYRLRLRPQEFKPAGVDETLALAEEWLIAHFVEAVRKCFKDGGFTKKENEREEGGQFLIGYQGYLWRMESDFQIARSVNRYDAVGSGSELALGALTVLFDRELVDHIEPQSIVREALIAAATFSAHVRPPYNYVSVSPMVEPAVGVP